MDEKELRERAMRCSTRCEVDALLREYEVLQKREEEKK